MVGGVAVYSVGCDLSKWVVSRWGRCRWPTDVVTVVTTGMYRDVFGLVPSSQQCCSSLMGILPEVIHSSRFSCMQANMSAIGS